MGYAGEAMNELHGTDVFTEESRLSACLEQPCTDTAHGHDSQPKAERKGMTLDEEFPNLYKKRNIYAKDEEGREYLKQTILMEVERELAQARKTHKPMNSHHEGYAVILEELDELWEVCKQNTHKFGSEAAVREEQRKFKRAAMRKEALQIAAMAVRFIEDVCDK